MIDEISTEACEQAEAVEVETGNLPGEHKAAPKTAEVENETEVENESAEVEHSGSNQLETETSGSHDGGSSTSGSDGH